MEDKSIEDLKLAINNLVWTYAPDGLTLKSAEIIACDILGMIKSGVDIDGLKVERIST